MCSQNPAKRRGGLGPEKVEQEGRCKVGVCVGVANRREGRQLQEGARPLGLHTLTWGKRGGCSHDSFARFLDQGLSEETEVHQVAKRNVAVLPRRRRT